MCCLRTYNNRAKAYSEVCDRNLTEKEVVERREIRQAAEKLYQSDMGDTLGNELIQFGGLVADTLACDLENEVPPEATMYQMLNKREISGILNIS